MAHRGDKMNSATNLSVQRHLTNRHARCVAPNHGLIRHSGISALRVSTAPLRFTDSDRCQTDIARLPFAHRWASSMSHHNRTNHAPRALIDRASCVRASIDRNWTSHSSYRRFSRRFPLSGRSALSNETTRISAMPATWGSHEDLYA